jgi:hypothetical protein
MLMTPFRVAAYRIRGRNDIGPLLWDLLGFAEYLYVVKK